MMLLSIVNFVPLATFDEQMFTTLHLVDNLRILLGKLG